MFLVSFGNTFVHSLRSMMFIGTFIRSVVSECLSSGPKRKHIRKGAGQQSVSVSNASDLLWTILHIPAAHQPPSTFLQILTSSPLSTSFPQSHAVHSLHHPRFSHNSPPTRITPLIRYQAPASKISSLTPTSPTDLTSWKWLLVISQHSPTSSSCLLMTTFDDEKMALLSMDQHAQWKDLRSSGQGRLAAGLHRGLARGLSSKLLSSLPTLTT